MKKILKFIITLKEKIIKNNYIIIIIIILKQILNVKALAEEDEEVEEVKVNKAKQLYIFLGSLIIITLVGWLLIKYELYQDIDNINNMHQQQLMNIKKSLEKTKELTSLMNIQQKKLSTINNLIFLHKEGEQNQET